MYFHLVLFFLHYTLVLSLLWRSKGQMMDCCKKILRSKRGLIHKKNRIYLVQIFKGYYIVQEPCVLLIPGGVMGLARHLGGDG